MNEYIFAFVDHIRIEVENALPATLHLLPDNLTGSSLFVQFNDCTIPGDAPDTGQRI